MRLLTTGRFERDLGRTRRRGKNLDKLWAVVDGLLARGPRIAPPCPSAVWSMDPVLFVSEDG